MGTQTEIRLQPINMCGEIIEMPSLGNAHRWALDSTQRIITAHTHSNQHQKNGEEQSIWINLSVRLRTQIAFRKLYISIWANVKQWRSRILPSTMCNQLVCRRHRWQWMGSIVFDSPLFSMWFHPSDRISKCTSSSALTTAIDQRWPRLFKSITIAFERCNCYYIKFNVVCFRIYTHNCLVLPIKFCW